MGAERAIGPSWNRGWVIFTTRPITLAVTLVVAVIASVISMGLLFFPAIVGFHHAIRYGRREMQFIDLAVIANTIGLFFQGVGRDFVGAWVLGITGSALPVALFVLPVVPLYRPEATISAWNFLLMLLWIPSSILLGAVLLYGFPNLVEQGHGASALRETFFQGRSHKLLAFTIGFLLVFPVTGFIFHLLYDSSSGLVN